MRQLMSYSWVVDEKAMNIAELAVAAGLSRRAIRFYVQRGLLSPPLGRGRGRHYDRSQLQQLQRIRQLQAAGHSLEAIRKIQTGQAVEPPDVPGDVRARPRVRPTLTAALWSRFEMADGVELLLDATKYNPEVKNLLAIQHVIRELLSGGNEKAGSESNDGDS